MENSNFNCGNFEGLYTFEADEIYGFGDLCFRKQMAREKLLRYKNRLSIDRIK